MKRTIIILGAVIIAALCAVYISTRGGNETVIVNPEYDTNGADYFLLHKIERTDTATVLYAGVYHLPNYWVLISDEIKLKDSKGKTYKLLRCDGFELDKEVFMPESGTMAFALYFEPVDKDEKEVDIIDMDENKKTITGVKLYNVKHNEPVRCVLKGEVINRPQSSRIALLKSGEDFRAAKVTCIPILDGKFEYTLYADAEEAYQLIFYDEILQASWYHVDFIAESGTCYFTLNSVDKRDNNSIRGSKYTEIYLSVGDSLRKQMQPLVKALDDKMDKLYEEKKYYIPEVNVILDKIDSLPTDAPQRRDLFEKLDELIGKGAGKTLEAKELDNEHFRIHKTMYVDKLVEYAKEHTDIVGYTLLVEMIRHAILYSNNRLNVKPMFDIFHDLYETKYPDHPYTATIKSHIQSAAIAVGKPCPDIVLDDDKGNNVHLSELIKGKVALVHLWASWCGPCRRHGKEMIPVYEMYKDKGFTVVSIAREQRKESMTAAVKQDGYPWTNFLELNDGNGIWTIFGVGNAGGGDFLVDAQGNFLAVKTSPKEMKEILQNMYQPIDITPARTPGRGHR
ncbi:MAG: redoxin domain-containing protein [Odoribacteraceae bacterium]|jgi:thiol-disulfide isomerase/thioredoxin|nr:redoxin domain-containing protein [Odoribacteraceae bacterium]